MIYTGLNQASDLVKIDRILNVTERDNLQILLAIHWNTIVIQIASSIQ